MRQLLIIVGLALAIQALPISEPTTEAPVISQAPLRFNADRNNEHVTMRSLPEPGPGPISSTEGTTAHPFLSTDLINQHVLMGWSLPQPGPGPRPTREAPVVPSGPAEHPSLSADLIKKHSLMGWTLPQPGPGPRPTREAPSSEPTASKTSLFSPELMQQHLLMGWSLPQPVSGPRPTTVQPDTDSSLSPVHLEDPKGLALSTPPPRSIRAAPRPLPAHKAHGPRAILPYGPYATRQNVKV